MAPSPLTKPAGLYRPLADINVTPLVDVMLVLLVIFMVTAPMLATGLKVDLPQAKKAQPLDPKKPIVVTVGKDGGLSIGDEETTKDALVAAVLRASEGDPTRIIHLRGDRQAVYGDVVAVMDLLAQNGMTHLAIVADAREKAESKAAAKGDAALNGSQPAPAGGAPGAPSVPNEVSAARPSAEPAAPEPAAPQPSAPAAPATR